MSLDWSLAVQCGRRSNEARVPGLVAADALVHDRAGSEADMADAVDGDDGVPEVDAKGDAAYDVADASAAGWGAYVAAGSKRPKGC